MEIPLFSEARDARRNSGILGENGPYALEERSSGNVLLSKEILENNRLSRKEARIRKMEEEKKLLLLALIELDNEEKENEKNIAIEIENAKKSKKSIISNEN